MRGAIIPKVSLLSYLSRLFLLKAFHLKNSPLQAACHCGGRRPTQKTSACRDRARQTSRRCKRYVNNIIWHGMQMKATDEILIREILRHLSESCFSNHASRSAVTTKLTYPEVSCCHAGDVTKIEVVLEEAPNAIVVGSMSSELEATAELNSTFPDGESINPRKPPRSAILRPPSVSHSSLSLSLRAKERDIISGQRQ